MRLSAAMKDPIASSKKTPSLSDARAPTAWTGSSNSKKTGLLPSLAVSRPMQYTKSNYIITSIADAAGHHHQRGGSVKSLNNIYGDHHTSKRQGIGMSSSGITVTSGNRMGCLLKRALTPARLTSNSSAQLSMVAVVSWCVMLAAVLPGRACAVRSMFQPGSLSLHYTTAGQRHDDGSRQMPGVYSGKFIPAAVPEMSVPETGHGDGPSFNTTFDDLRRLDFGCTQVDNTVHSGLHIKAISYDKNTQEVLIVEDNVGKVDVLHGHLCHVQRNPCIGMPEWNKLPCILCKIASDNEGLLGPFAIHNHTVYFIYIPDHVDNHSRLKHHKVIQLRMLTGCESKYPIYNNFNVGKCSKLLSSYTSRSHHMQPASDLTIMELGDNRIFLTQARTYDWDNPQRTTYSHVGMILVGFHKVDRRVGVRVHLLDSQTLPLPSLHLSLHNVGGIDFYMNTVCWSMFDHIYCGRMTENGRKLANKTLVVKPGRAALVCMGEDHNITTGVAIVTATKASVTLIFGCVAHRMSEGGMGVAHLTHHADGTDDVQIHQGSDRHGPVMAGSMFITRKLSCMTNNSTPTGQTTHINRHSGGTASVSASPPVGIVLIAIVGLGRALCGLRAI